MELTRLVATESANGVFSTVLSVVAPVNARPPYNTDRSSQLAASAFSAS